MYDYDHYPTLIIADKPETGRAIADAFKCETIENKAANVIYVPSGLFKITWARGPLLELMEPQDYDPKYSDWNVEDLPICFPNWGKKIRNESGAREYLKCIKAHLNNVQDVWNAGDPDDEGQAIVDDILAACRWRGPVYRLNTSNTTVEGLRKAFPEMDDNTNHRGAYNASYARQVSDMLFRVNLTRYFTVKNPAVGTINIDRVQTPTLGLVARRDAEIESHVKQKYYVVTPTADVGDTSGIRFNVNFLEHDDPRLDNGRVVNRSTAKEVVEAIRGRRGYGKVEKKVVKERAPLPLNLTELQTQCGNKFGYTPEMVLKITQELHDKYRCISYSCTDCRYLTEEHFKDASEVAAAVAENAYEWNNVLTLPRKTELHSRCFNDDMTRGEAHTALIPTVQRFKVANLSLEQRNVYFYIVIYYLIQFLPPAFKEITTITIPIDDTMTISSSSSKYIRHGFRGLLYSKNEIYDTSELTSLSDVPAGQTYYEITSVDISEAETKPPARYTQTSLNADMCRISKFCTDERICALLRKKDKYRTGENGAIGTPATRAGIISDLIRHGYLKEDEKHFLTSTSKARELCRVLPKKYVEPDLAAEWWVMQEDIRQGRLQPDAMIQSVLDSIAADLHDVYDNFNPEAMGAADTGYIGVCPWCGGQIFENTKGYGCTNWKTKGCKFTIWKQAKNGMFKDVPVTKSMARDLLARKTLKSDLLYSKKTDSHFTGSFHLDTDRNNPYTPQLVPDFFPR